MNNSIWCLSELKQLKLRKNFIYMTSAENHNSFSWSFYIGVVDNFICIMALHASGNYLMLCHIIERVCVCAGGGGGVSFVRWFWQDSQDIRVQMLRVVGESWIMKNCNFIISQAHFWALEKLHKLRVRFSGDVIVTHEPKSGIEWLRQSNNIRCIQEENTRKIFYTYPKQNDHVRYSQKGSILSWAFLLPKERWEMGLPDSLAASNPMCRQPGTLT